MVFPSPVTIDESGNVYGMVEVMTRAASLPRSSARWNCICDCGRLFVTTGRSLRSGKTSCGCCHAFEVRSALVKVETGNRYGRWLVVGYSETKTSGAFWDCVCDCGATRSVSGHSLRMGRSTSCGCLKSDLLRQRLQKPKGESARNSALATSKRNAQRRGLTWGLTDEQALKLFLGNCNYCNSDLSNRFQRTKTHGGYAYNGIDRVDNDRGYELDNCVSCCKHCNVAKRARSVTEFLAWIARVHEHSNVRKDR